MEANGQLNALAVLYPRKVSGIYWIRDWVWTLWKEDEFRLV
jgi:hypothetical protein